MPRAKKTPTGNIGASIVKADVAHNPVNDYTYVSLKVYGELAKRIVDFHNAFGMGGSVNETIREMLILALDSPITRESAIATVRLRALAEARSWVYDREREFFDKLLKEIDVINKAAKEAEAAARALPIDTPGA